QEGLIFSDIFTRDHRTDHKQKPDRCTEARVRFLRPSPNKKAAKKSRPDDMCVRPGHLVARAAAQKVPYIYKKTDSALRGNVGAELGAMLAASGEKALPFLPAYPQMGRCTKGGVHYIDGQPVAESVFGIDPFEPVRHSDLAGLIGAQSGVPVHSLPADAPARSGQGLYGYDACSHRD